jgi:cell division protein ZapA (FtsZ GTPase activity inhibitor)
MNKKDLTREEKAEHIAKNFDYMVDVFMGDIKHMQSQQQVIHDHNIALHKAWNINKELLEENEQLKIKLKEFDTSS